MSKYIIAFPSIYHAFRAKKILTTVGISAELTHVPWELSHSCEGLAISLQEQDLTVAVELLGSSGVIMLKKGINVAEKD